MAVVSSSASVKAVFSLASGPVGRPEGDAAEQDGGQRLRAQREAVGAQLRIDAAGLPEARVDAHELVVRRVDENTQRHAAPVAVQFVGRHLADLDAPEIHRRTHVERADVGGAQQELLARGITRDDGRHLQPLELARGFLRHAGIGADVGA
jgi:hypothetical protein